MRKSAGIAIASIAAVIGLAACGTSNPAASSAPQTSTTQTGVAHTTPNAETIAARMGLHVTAYNTTTDPNSLLGRQGEYTSKVEWGGWTSDSGDSNNGGSIEVFSTNADLIARADYLSAFRPPFGDGYDFSVDTALLRLRAEYTPSQAHAEEARFSAAVNG